MDDLYCVLIVVVILVLSFLIRKYKVPYLFPITKKINKAMEFYWPKRVILGPAIVMFSFVVSMICLSIFFKFQPNISNLNALEYINNTTYMNMRQLKYVGGTTVYDSSVNNIKRWYPLYMDVDTKEILRGLNTENYINAGFCKVGLDKVDVRKERNTKKGFQKYILDWTGSILYKEKSIDLPEKMKGMSQATQDYNKPIDIVADKNWNTSREYNGNDKFLISSISEVKNYSINDSTLEASGRFTENEYIFNILRNCFGFISDDFYDISNGKINFSEIELKDVAIGDIGTIKDDDGNIKMGICVGYNSKKNPIFSVCTNIKKSNSNYYNKITKYIGAKDNEIGFNILTIEKNGIFAFLFHNRLFEKYYHTNLPFVDDNKYINDNVNPLLSITNIEEYNKQVFFKWQKQKNTWDGSDLEKKLYEERIDRIKQREDNALKYRQKSSINIDNYKDIDIQNLYNIYDIGTYEYKNFVNNYTDEEKEYYKKTYSKEYKEEQKNIQHTKNVNKYVEKIMSMENQIKGKSFDDVKKIFEVDGVILSFEGEQILRECYDKINNN